MGTNQRHEPLVMKTIVDKIRGRTFGKTFNLKQSSLIVTSSFKIKVACAHCNVTSTYKMKAKSKKDGL
jgi:biotin synthase-like enzyme